MAQAEFAVRLVCLSDHKVDDRVLRRSSFPLGFQLNRMNLVVAGRDVDDDTCRFIFDMTTMESGVLAAISSVTLTEGTCEYEGLCLLQLLYTASLKKLCQLWLDLSTFDFNRF